MTRISKCLHVELEAEDCAVEVTRPKLEAFDFDLGIHAFDPEAADIQLDLDDFSVEVVDVDVLVATYPFRIIFGVKAFEVRWFAGKTFEI